jgi:hypothetical protein
MGRAVDGSPKIDGDQPSTLLRNPDPSLPRGVEFDPGG